MGQLGGLLSPPPRSVDKAGAILLAGFARFQITRAEGLYLQKASRSSRTARGAVTLNAGGCIGIMQQSASTLCCTFKPAVGWRLLRSPLGDAIGGIRSQAFSQRLEIRCRGVGLNPAVARPCPTLRLRFIPCPSNGIPPRTSQDGRLMPLSRFTRFSSSNRLAAVGCLWRAVSITRVPVSLPAAPHIPLS